jgi:hypothetical protein
MEAMFLRVGRASCRTAAWPERKRKAAWIRIRIPLLVWTTFIAPREEDLSWMSCIARKRTVRTRGEALPGWLRVWGMMT